MHAAVHRYRRRPTPDRGRMVHSISAPSPYCGSVGVIRSAVLIQINPLVLLTRDEARRHRREHRQAAGVENDRQGIALDNQFTLQLHAIMPGICTSLIRQSVSCKRPEFKNASADANWRHCTELIACLQPQMAP